MLSMQSSPMPTFFRFPPWSGPWSRRIPDTFIAANVQREPGALLQDRRTGSFFLPDSEDDWAHTHEHRGALGGVVAQPADLPIS